MADRFRAYEVQAANVEDFLQRYYRPERFAGHERGLITSYTAELRADGFTFISRFDSVTGRTVSYYGGS